MKMAPLVTLCKDELEHLEKRFRIITKSKNVLMKYPQIVDLRLMLDTEKERYEDVPEIVI
jgi:hypothetical protein